MRFDFAILTLVVLIVPALAAQTWNVTVVNGLFVPQVVNIQPGDTVLWPLNDGAVHAIVQTVAGARSCNTLAGGFNSGQKTNGQSYQRTFPNNATINYKDGVGSNCLNGATGTIIVGTANGTVTATGGGSTSTPGATMTTVPITKPTNAASVLSTPKSIILGAAWFVGAWVL